MADTQSDLYLELASLTSTDRRLTASEERRRSWLVRELAERDTTRGVSEVRAMRDQWLLLESPEPILERDSSEC
jgi:hypothetical protein